ncbi:MAG: hypothetical protein SO141_05025, partial [Alphaproteobacteria bacterium]|nr:hypothetical protein [Alphaproteobacteria bacterium]
AHLSLALKTSDSKAASSSGEPLARFLLVAPTMSAPKADALPLGDTPITWRWVICKIKKI